MAEKNQLVKIIETNELETLKSKFILDSFIGFFDKAKSYEESAKKIVITDVSQTEEMKEARAIRLEVKSIRTNAENVRKQLKEQSLREGKAIDGIANVIKALTVPIEEYLEGQEKFIERMEEEKKAKLERERINLLTPYVDDVGFYNLKEMSQQGFEQLLESSKIAHKAKLAAEKKAEEDRIKFEQEEKAEHDRIRAENAILKEKADKREKEIADERRIADEEKSKLESELKEKRQAEQKIKDEEAEKVVSEERLQKEERYKEFLRENGVNSDTKHLFHLEKAGDKVKLYRVIAVFEINK